MLAAALVVATHAAPVPVDVPAGCHVDNNRLDGDVPLLCCASCDAPLLLDTSVWVDYPRWGRDDDDDLDDWETDDANLRNQPYLRDNDDPLAWIWDSSTRDPLLEENDDVYRDDDSRARFLYESAYGVEYDDDLWWQPEHNDVYWDDDRIGWGVRSAESITKQRTGPVPCGACITSAQCRDAGGLENVDHRVCVRPDAPVVHSIS